MQQSSSDYHNNPITLRAFPVSSHWTSSVTSWPPSSSLFLTFHLFVLQLPHILDASTTTTLPYSIVHHLLALSNPQHTSNLDASPFR